MRKQCGCKACRETTKISAARIRDLRETTRVQCNDNPNCYWLRKGRHELNDKPYWTTDIRGQENKSDIKRNGKGSTV